MIIKILTIAAIIGIFGTKSLSITSVPLLYSKGDHFVVPLTIKGKTYAFVVDTGASTSSISSAVADELNLSRSGAERKVALVAVKEIVTEPMLNAVLCKIGTFPFFANFKISSYSESLYTDEIHGILGADVILRYRWLFDFENGKVTLSKWLPFKVKRDSDYCWEIDFEVERIRMSILDLTLNDSIPARFVLDTGWGYYTFGEGQFTPEITFMIADSTDTTFNYFSKQNRESLQVVSGGKNIDLLFSRGLEINNSPPINMLATVDIDDFYDSIGYKDDGISGLVNRSIMTRHRQVVYDPRRGKMIFYKSPDDTPPYSDENTNFIFNAIPNNGQ